MTAEELRAAQQALLARKEALVASVSKTEAILAELFDRQQRLVRSKRRNKAAICTRRAGKTSIWPRYATCVAISQPRSLVRIWAINRLRAKQLLWAEFALLFARHGIKVQMHETELTIKFENGSEIRLLGADKSKEAEKKRGDKTTLEVVLETQLFGPYLKSLVEDIIEPCLFDTNGTICLEGTPGPVATGFWYNITAGHEGEEVWESEGMAVATGARDDNGQAIKELVGAGWEVHHWSLTDNPKVDQWVGKKNWQELAKLALEEVRKKRHWTADNPTFVREYRGRWVKDDSSLFYKFNEVRNTFTLAEVQPWGPGWTHVLGWDLGYRDDMALVAWGWHPSRRELYCAGEWKKPGALAEEVMAQIERWEKLGFNFIAKVADTGGGGRMYVEEVMSRYSQVFEAAKKTEKVDHVRLMNDDFLTGKIKVQRGGEYAAELSTLPKDPDWDPDSGKPQGEDSRFPNHLVDSGLYSWRKALTYIDFREEQPPPTMEETIASQEDKYVESLEKKGKEEHDWWEREDYDSEY